MNLMKNKKGELTTKQLVTLIILITSFVVILLLIWRLNLGEETDKEICRNSVILGAKSSGLSGPLDCKTNYLCISGGDDCEGFVSSSTDELNFDGSNDKEEVMKNLANEMSDCWWQFGEGKVDYGQDANDVDYALCTKIRFDEKSQEKVSEISYSEFYNYLEKTDKEEGISYLSYLYGVDTVSSLRIEEQFKVDLNKDKILTSEEYSLFTGVDNNVFDFIDDDEILRVYLIPSSETSVRLDEDRSIITKA